MSASAATALFQFGRHVISSSQVFFQSRFCFAFTNRKPVLPDILVATRRVVPRLHQLTEEEVEDLFRCVHRIAPVVEREFRSTGLTIAVQDGRDAGQTVEHVHVHVIPRRPGDFVNNDDIYRELEVHDSTNTDNKGSFRPLEEMAVEAANLSKFLK